MPTQNTSSLSLKLVIALFAAAVLTSPTLFAGRGGGGGMGAAQPKKPAAPAPDTVLKDKYDKNHNGKLDKDELQVIHDSDRSLFDELIKFDTSKDNIIDASELTKWADSKKTKTPTPAAGGGGAGGGGRGGPGGA